MSQSSNYNCISADCARLVYREYLPPVIRWRYPGEEWQEIEADNYAIEQETGKCLTQYRIRGEFKFQSRAFRGLECGSIQYWNTGIPEGKIISFDFSENIHYRFCKIKVVLETISGNIETHYAQVDTTGSDITWNPGFTAYYFDGCGNYGSRGGNDFVVNEIERTDGQPDNCGDCILIITKNGEIIHEENRDVCPEVEKLPCRLSDVTKEIKIEKTPFLSVIEVTQIDNDAVRVKGVPFPLQGVGKAPDECWNIYRNEIFDPFPSGDPNDPNEPAFGDYIDQICSAPGCPPPEYEVICNCDEQCPDGTCEVFCGEYLCCYDSTGKAVKAIHYSNIPDFGIPDNTVGGTSA